MEMNPCAMAMVETISPQQFPSLQATDLDPKEQQVSIQDQWPHRLYTIVFLLLLMNFRIMALEGLIVNLFTNIALH